MANSTSWQKSMIFASKGRMVGYRLTLHHYNTVLFSQSIWGRALEIVKVVRAMQEDGVQPNGASYYYICNGMANADHGYNFDFPLNHRLEKLQHWRVAIEALQACEANGFDTSDTMHNSTIISCVIPGFNRWALACQLLQRMIADERKMHPTAVRFLHDCLIRNMRPREASELMRMAAEQRVEGYERAWEIDVFAMAEKRHLSIAEEGRRRLLLESAKKDRSTTGMIPRSDGSAAPISETEVHAMNKRTSADPERLRRLGKMLRDKRSVLAAAAGRTSTPGESSSQLTKEEEDALAAERGAPELFQAGLHSTEINSAFRPRVYRQLWYRWHAIANKYRPTKSLKKRQLAPRDSPTGISGFSRI
jgi:hypothetical protein